MPPLYPAFAIDLNCVTNAGPTSAVGVTVEVYDDQAIYAVTLPPGRLYTAWSYNSSVSGFNTLFQVTADGVTVAKGDLGPYASAAAAYAAFPGATLTGSKRYALWLYDAGTLADNLGGMSLLLTRTN